MRISGTATVNATPDRVWAALNDPDVLVLTIPGCSRLDADGADTYRMTITAGVASVKGTYTGQVSLHDQQPPGSFRLLASGSGAPGTVRADVAVRLVATGDATTVSYDADAEVGGMIGGVGQRLLSGVAKRTAGEFFGAVDDVLSGRAVPAVAPGAAATVGVPAAQGAGWVREPAGRAVQVDVRNSLAAVAFGAVAALVGVLLGWSIGRRR